MYVAFSVVQTTTSRYSVNQKFYYDYQM